MAQKWQERIRPVRLEKRYEFLDYVNITIHLNDGEETISDDQRRFAQQLDELAGKVGRPD